MSNQQNSGGAEIYETADELYKQGIKLLRGDEVQRDIAKGLDLIHEAALQGHELAKQKLKCNFFIGPGESEHDGEVLIWWSKLAEFGDEGAKKALAELRARGRIP